MDEPTTGLDPESRCNLWQVIKNAKEKRAIILTSNMAFKLLFKKRIVSFLISNNFYEL